MSNRHRSPPNLRSTLNESRPSPSLMSPINSRLAGESSGSRRRRRRCRRSRSRRRVHPPRLHGNCFHGATTARFIEKLRTKVVCCLVRHYGDFSSQGLFQSLNESVHRSFVPRFHEPRTAVNAFGWWFGCWPSWDWKGTGRFGRRLKNTKGWKNCKDLARFFGKICG